MFLPGLLFNLVPDLPILRVTLTALVTAASTGTMRIGRGTSHPGHYAPFVTDPETTHPQTTHPQTTHPVSTERRLAHSDSSSGGRHSKSEDGHTQPQDRHSKPLGGQGHGADVVIVGAGIGGLTAAAALHRAGFSVRVMEQAKQIMPVGAGLTIQPNAVTALARMGLGDAVKKAGQPLQAASIRDATGRVLSEIDRDSAARLLTRVGAQALGLHRATLHGALMDEAGDCITLGAQVTSANDAGVALDSGAHVSAQLVIGADGLRSTVRRLLHNDGEPRYSGYYCWRGVTSASAFPADWAGEFWGQGLRFGGCGIDGNRTYWFAVANGPAGGSTPIGDRFDSFPAEVRDTIAATDPTTVLRTDIADRDPIRQWGRGHISLLGDAAHAMTPNLGQGACQAVEDALVLANCVQRLGPNPEALRAYERIRAPRANRTVLMARRLGAIGQWHNPLLCRVRDETLRLTPSAVLTRQLRAAWQLPG